jgi:thioesterase domain-containing protein
MALLVQGQVAGLLNRDVTLEQLRRRFRIFTAHQHALENYVPSAYEGPLTVLRARDAWTGGDSSLGWDAALGRGVTIIEVPGNHQTLLEAPHVATLADYLRTESRSIRSRSRSPDDHP